MLSMLALCFVAVLSLLDILRRQVLGRLATQAGRLCSRGPVLASIVNNARAGEGGNVHTLRSLQQVRGFISSPTMLLLIDGPIAPIYFAVIFLIHPHLGFIAVACGLLLGAIAVLNQQRDGGAAEPGQPACGTGRCDGRNRWRATRR